MVQELLDAAEAVVLIRVAVLHELDVGQLQCPDEQHRVLEVDVVVGDAVVDHEVFATQRLHVGKEAAPVVAGLLYFKTVSY